MKFLSSLSAIIITLSFVSCTKETTRLEEPEENWMKLKDSCSYTIDGKRYTCDLFGSFMRGRSAANLDTVTLKWDADTSLYYVGFSILKLDDGDKKDGGSLNVTFIKKYGNNQLTKTWPIGILGPVSEKELYAKGEYNYAVDYKKFNYQSGVAMRVVARADGLVESLFTYMDAPAITPGPHSQNNSKFEITQVLPHPKGGHLLEAKFTATVFNNLGQAKRLEDGYFRVHFF